MWGVWERSNLPQKGPTVLSEPKFGPPNQKFLDPPLLSPFFPTRIGSTVPKCQKLCIRLVVGIARIPTLQKQSEGCMTEKLNILRGSQVPVMHLLSQTTSRQLVTTSNGSTLRYWQNGRSDTHCKIKGDSTY